MIEGSPINVKDFGVVGDGVTDNFSALQSVAASLTDNTTVVFPPGEYLISYSTPRSPSLPNGVVAFSIKDLKNIKIIAQGATIKIVNHDLLAFGGLTVFGIDGSQNVEISGFEFDLSFVNRNDSSDYYPFCGAIIARDTSGSAGSRTDNELSSGIKVRNNIFNLYHPLGAFAQAANSFPGDPNNGFKIYPFTALGDNTATAAANQNFDIEFTGNRFLRTHNAYGFWAWSFNNVIATNNIADGWANYSTDSSGTPTGISLPLFRYHQFYCSGLNISNNIMRPRPLADRVGAYQGRAYFADIVTNLTNVDHFAGESLCSNNEMALATNDSGIRVNVCGTVNIIGNIINGLAVADRPIAGIDILCSLSDVIKGRGYYNIIGNTTNRFLSCALVRVDNGAALSQDRRLKVLTIKNNVSLNSFGAAVSFVNNGSRATSGVELMYCDDNVFDAVASEFGSVNVNGAGVQHQLANVATDLFYIRNNVVRHFYNVERGGTSSVVSFGNVGTTVTASTNFNYLLSNDQLRSSVEVAAGTIPRVGVANVDFFSYYATRVDNTSGLILQVSSGEVPGGTALAAATPAGQTWYIDQTLIAKKGI
jgi:hypothetical protein